MSGRGSGRKEYGICNPKISGKGKKDMPEMWFQDSNFCGLRLVAIFLTAGLDWKRPLAGPRTNVRAFQSSGEKECWRPNAAGSPRCLRLGRVVFSIQRLIDMTVKDPRLTFGQMAFSSFTH
jgi:hypothetical protein